MVDAHALEVDSHVLRHYENFYYLNHAVTNESEGLAYVEAYRAAALAGDGFDHDFVLDDGTVLPRTLYEDWTKEDARKIPVLIEKVGHHPKNFTFLGFPVFEIDIGGAHVLFSDGNYQFMEMDEGFPMTSAFIEALESIDE